MFRGVIFNRDKLVPRAQNGRDYALKSARALPRPCSSTILGSSTTCPRPSMWSGRIGCGRSFPTWNERASSPTSSGRLAAGAVLHGTRSAVRDGRPTVALVRPPGHHAGPDYGGGFCYLNNVAVAAADQVAEGRRVAVLDYDAHHGNGTRDIFADSASVLYLSTHEYGIYPGTGPAEDVGTGEGRGFTVNIPFSAGCGDTSYLAAHDRIVEPIVEEFRPDLILVSLGIDAHYRDPLTSLVLSSPGYVELVTRSVALATRLCGSRFAVALEGGYHLDALGEVIAGVVARFRGRSIPLALSEVLDDKGRGGRASEGTIRTHRPFWNLR